MKYPLTIILINIIFWTGTAQNISVKYNSKSLIDTLSIGNLPDSAQEILKDLAKGHYYQLIIKNQESLYAPQDIIETSVKSKKESTKDQLGNVKSTQSITNVYTESIYKDISNQSMISQLNSFGNTYLVNENMANAKWEITNEKEKIGDFLCQKASAFINGDFVQAWFTSEIPVANGPSIYSNLPGLILQIKFGKRLITATEIKYDISINEINPPKKGTTISREDYEKIKNDFKNTESGKSVNGNTTTTTTVIRH